MKNNKGYSLIEILIALGILSIISGITYVSYQGYTVSVNKKDLKLRGKLFATSVKNCITATGGWEIKGLTSAGLPTNNSLYPCKPEGTTQDNIKESLKNRLDFTCPAGTECKIFTRDGHEPRLRYTCLSIEKEVSGKKLQVISRVAYENPSTYEIWCNEVTDYFIFDHMRCRQGAPGQMKEPRQSNNPTSELKKGCPDW